MRTKRALAATISGFILLVASLAVGLSMLAAQSPPAVWTGKVDYGPNELVDIHGRDFMPGSWYRVLVVWPDGSARVAGNNGVVLCTDVTAADGSSCFLDVLADDDGMFLLRYQLLNGLTGEYRIFVYDQAAAIVAQGTFTDDSSGPGNSHSHLVRNSNEKPGKAQAPRPTAFESQRKVFRNPRGQRHLFALVVMANDETPQAGGLAGGLWLFRSTDAGTTWSPLQRLSQDNGNPPAVSGSLWTYDDGTQTVVYVVYSKDGGGSGHPIFYRMIQIPDASAPVIGAEQSTGLATDGGGDRPDAARPVIVRDRNGFVHVAFWKSRKTLGIFGTLQPNPGDSPIWSGISDVITSAALENGTQNLAVLMPFNSGALLGYAAVARVGTTPATRENRLFARDVSTFDSVAGTYALGTLRDLGGITRNLGYLPLSGVVDTGNVASILYIKDCPGSGGGACASASAGSAIGVYSRKAAAAGSVDSWAPAVQVSSSVPETAALAVDPGPNPDRLYAFFATNLGVVSFKSSPADVIAWTAAGCSDTGGTVSGTQCNIVVESNAVDDAASSYGAPVQALWSVNSVGLPVKHYYLNTAPNVTLAFTPDGTNGWFTTSPTPAGSGIVTAVDDGTVASISCTGPVSMGPLVGGGTPQGSRTVSVIGETSGVSISCTATDDDGVVSAVDTKIVKVDATAPSVVSSRLPAANGEGWNNTDVTVSFTCSDALSGLAGASLPATQAQTLSAEGAGQAASRSCADNAGNSGSLTVSNINIDKTPPAYGSSSRSPAANGNGWSNQDVTVSFPCLDALSGPGSAVVEITLTAEGGGQTANAAASACTDRAGNVAASGASLGGINIDKTAPAITGNRSPAANLNGWNNTDVTVHFACTDGLSTLAVGSPPEDTLLSSEGAGQSVDGTCTDLADNSATAKVANINIDKTKPAAAADASPGPNAQGWNNTEVTVTFRGTDELSGIDFCDPPVTFSLEGLGLSASGSCTDKAGNLSDTATAGGIDIDKTKPVVASSASPTANAAGWHNTDVTVGFTCTDAGGVQSGIQSNTLTSVMLTSEGAGQSASSSGDCVDKADNAADGITVGAINIDKTAPVITPNRSPAANANGWNNTDVTVRFACTDGLSGLAAGSPPADSVLSAEGGGQSANGTCTDLADNSGSAGVSNVNIDKTAPIITGSRSPGVNGNGWNNTDVTVHFACADGLSGLAAGSPPVDTVLSAEGSGQSAGGTCTDLADNSAAADVSDINIDKTPPEVDATRTPAPNANGWNNTDVTGHWTGSDALSGLGVLTEYAFIFPNEGSEQTGSFGFTDLAGNTTTVAIEHVNIDKTPPAITGSRSPGANVSGWNHTDVAVHFDCADNLSGLVAGSPPADTVLSAEGAGQSVSGTCTDLAENAASNTVSDISIDKTAPAVSLTRTPGPNANGWNNTSVTAHWSASDMLSGLLDDASEYEYVFTFEGAAQIATYGFTDLAGNTTSLTISGVNIDKTAPDLAFGTAAPAPNAAGWHKTDVAVPFVASDNLAGIASTSPGSPLILISEGAAVTGDVTVTDRADNSATFTSAVFKIDKTAPTIGIVSPGNGEIDILNGLKAASYNCADGLSGVAGCSGPVASGANIDTASVGAKSFTVTASDAAGNAAALTAGYRVQYLAAGACNGAPGHAILQPVNADGSSVFKQRSTVPSKFRVCDALGASIGAPGVVTSFKLIATISGVVTTTLDDDPVSTTPDSAFRWDPTDRQWIFNLNTKNLSASRTYIYLISLNDDTAIQYQFGLK